MDHAQFIARAALEIGAIKISVESPFTWASGYRMPVYNDNRLLLGSWDHRRAVAIGFRSVMETHSIPGDVIAGTATAGIPPATTLANLLELPLIYVRSASKAHGMQNQIEGILQPGQRVVVIEDLVSTGGSSLKAVEAIRRQGGIVNDCLCIFSYGFPQSEQAFKKSDCALHTLLSFPELVAYGQKNQIFGEDEVDSLTSWYKDPFQWGANNGFANLE